MNRLRSKPIWSLGRIEQKLRRLWSRSKSIALLGLLCLVIVGLIVSGWLLVRNVANNRLILASTSGGDAPVAETAPAPVLFARLQFLLLHDRFDEAQALMDVIERAGDPAALARARYNFGNARMRLAFHFLERSQLDRATPLINLARDDYRRAVRLDPDLWDARYNLDVAMRLIRDYPSFDSKGDETRAGEKALWTDVPGIPKGEP
jgi:mxaK protein